MAGSGTPTGVIVAACADGSERFVCGLGAERARFSAGFPGVTSLEWLKRLTTVHCTTAFAEPPVSRYP